MLVLPLLFFFFGSPFPFRSTSFDVSRDEPGVLLSRQGGFSLIFLFFSSSHLFSFLFPSFFFLLFISFPFFGYTVQLGKTNGNKKASDGVGVRGGLGYLSALWSVEDDLRGDLWIS